MKEKWKKFVALILVFSIIMSSAVGTSNDIVKAEMTCKEVTAMFDDEIKATFRVTSQWDSHYNVDVTVKNVSEEKIDNWEIGWVHADNVENIWNAKVEVHEENDYIIRNADWNQDIPKDGEVTFGMTVSYKDEIHVPEDVYLTRDWVLVNRDYEVKYIENSRWDNHVNGEIVITNKSKQRIEDWSLWFDSNFEIENIWNAVVAEYSEEDGSYDIENATHNQNIEPGQSVRFGFIAKCTEKGEVKNAEVFEMARLEDCEDDSDWEDIEDESEEMIYDADDFDTYEEYLEYFYKINGKRVAMRATSNLISYDKVTALYKNKMDFGKNVKAVQHYLPFQSGEKNYVYTFHVDKDREYDVVARKLEMQNNNGELSYSKVVGKEVKFTKFSHGQTFEQFIYKKDGKEYYLLAGNAEKPDPKKKNAFATEILFMDSLLFDARIMNGSALDFDDWKSDKTLFRRLKGLSYANFDAKRNGTVKRADAAVSSDSSTLAIWTKMNGGKTQLSLYNLQKVSKLFFTKTQNKNPNKTKKTYKYALSFGGLFKKKLKKACYATYTAKVSSDLNHVLQPGGSFQSMDVEKVGSTWKVYITSGNENKGQTLQISSITLEKGKNKVSEKKISHINFDSSKFKKAELEGCHVMGDNLEFLVAPAGTVSKKEQYLYYTPRNTLEKGDE